MIVIGGASSSQRFDDVWEVNLSSFVWKEVIAGGKFEALSFHAGEQTPDGNILVFGGHTKDDLTNQISILNIKERKWGHPLISGDKPVPRQGHSLVYANGFYWAFGGYGAGNTLDDLYRLDFDDLSWKKIDAHGDRPGARENHAAATNGNTFYIAGGCNPDQGKCYENTWAFNTTTTLWQLEDRNSIIPRGGYAMDVIRGVIYAFGGNFFLDVVYDVLESFDTGDICPDNCSDHGTCTNEGCSCDPGLMSENCGTIAECENNCFDNGVCTEIECSCYPGYGGASCGEIIYCPQNCTDAT